jgi:hypothetical protein
MLGPAHAGPGYLQHAQINTQSNQSATDFGQGFGFLVTDTFGTFARFVQNRQFFNEAPTK